LVNPNSTTGGPRAYGMRAVLFSAQSTLAGKGTRSQSLLYRRTATAIGSPTQKMWMTTPMTIICKENG